MFRKIANRISILAGSPIVFIGAVLIVVCWVVTGPMFNYSEAWQLSINTFTTITTFLMVFLIQNTQNRDGKAVQLKLDELILSTRGRDALIDLEDMTDDEIAELTREFKLIHDQQAASQTMKKLHQQIELENKRRTGQ